LRKKRVTEELMLILKEENPVKALKRMEELGALKYVLPGVELNSDIIKKLEKARENYNFWKRNISEEKIELWLIYFFCIVGQLEKNKIQRMCKKLFRRKGQTISRC
ncbi:unnamed protein product, partial [marine sediment metagenome]